MSEINYVLIGKRIKETRSQMKLSQAALAEMAGLSARYISHIETARKKASLLSLVRIANAVGISVDEILYYIQRSSTLLRSVEKFMLSITGLQQMELY